MGCTKLVFNDIKFDSDEEVFFAMWLSELGAAGYVSKWTKVLTPIPLTEGLKIKYKKTTQLKTKLKIEDKEKTLLNPSVYTPDFRVEFTDKGFDLLCSYIDFYTPSGRFDPDAIFFTYDKIGQATHITKQRPFAFEVKPSFDQNNMERLFRNNQKFLWDKHQIFVNLVEPVSLFKKTFLPLQAEPYFKYRKAPTGKNKGKKATGDFKMDWQPKTLNEFICG